MIHPWHTSPLRGKQLGKEGQESGHCRERKSKLCERGGSLKAKMLQVGGGRSVGCVGAEAAYIHHLQCCVVRSRRGHELWQCCSYVAAAVILICRYPDYWGSATRTGDFKCREKTGFCRNRSMQTDSTGTLIGWKSGQTTFVPLWDRMEGAWLWTLEKVVIPLDC